MGPATGIGSPFRRVFRDLTYAAPTGGEGGRRKAQILA
jgi:hypothetical protein